MGHIATSVSISKFSHPDILIETFYCQRYGDIRVRITASTRKFYETIYDQFEANVWLEYFKEINS